MERTSKLVLAVLLIVTFASAQSFRFDDNSDWWSLLRVDEPMPEPSRIATPPTNFNILGLTLLDDNLFDAVTKRLGETRRVERGDAATGREQLCYVSQDGAVHLIFEQGEVESSFYLFRGGPPWRGSDQCRRSPTVTANVSTASGLRLGMTIAEVRRVLGSPSQCLKDKVIYARETRKKTPAKLLEEIRKNDPHHYSDEEFHRQFDFYDESVYIEARFVHSVLIYLAVSQSGTT